MKLENQVCNLELSKRLRELGVKQESLFAWLPFGEGYGLFYEWEQSKDEHISAFTVAELGEMLPSVITSVRTQEEYWKCAVVIEGENHLVEAATEADARAKMLVYLLENKLITL